MSESRRLSSEVTLVKLSSPPKIPPLALWHIDDNHNLIRYERWVICCWAIKLWANVTSARTVLPHWCKVIQGSLGLWIPNWRHWILDSSSVELGSRFQSLAGLWIPWAEFRIVPAKIFWISDFTRKTSPDPWSKIWINLHEANCKYCSWRSGSTPLKV